MFKKGGSNLTKAQLCATPKWQWLFTSFYFFGWQKPSAFTLKSLETNSGVNYFLLYFF